MANKYLDLAGLQRLVNKIKEWIPIKNSELENDSGFITIEDIPGGETQITIRHQERFIVGTSSIFEFTKGYYTLNANSVNWYLDGIKQSNDTLIEINNRTIEVVGGLPQGSTVVFDYVEYTNTVIGLEGPEGPEGEQGPRGLPGTTSWNGITDKPSSFSPSSHTHTKSQVGLGNVDNTSDASKPISTATQTALNGKVNNNQVLTNVPASAKFTDTVTTINSKTGAISKEDIVALGIPAQDTVYSHPSNHPASMITESTTKRFVSDSEKSTWNAKASKSVATTLSDGLMASADKSKLNEIQAGAQVNTVTSVAGKTGAVTVTKSDVSLGSVLNYGLSTQSEAETGASNAKYMTPLRTKQAIDKQVADKNYVTQSELGDAGFGDMVKSVYDINNNGVVDNAEKVNGFTVGTNVPSNAKFTDTVYTHPAGTNPHGTTKANVGLGSVLNYGISTQAEAQTGTSNAKYMTPLRTKQAISEQSTKVVTSATEPTLVVGDQWHKEI